MPKISDKWRLVAELIPSDVTKFALDKARSRGVIPHYWRIPMMQRATMKGLTLPSDFFEDDRPRRKPQRRKAA